MAAFLGFDPRKKSSQHMDHTPRDGARGMSALTKRHFDHVKRKMFAFVDRQHRIETDGKHLNSPQAFVQAQPVFVDQNKAPHHRRHHHTPAPPRKQVLPHQQLPHLALATPQAARRPRRSRPTVEEGLFSNIVFF